MHALCDLGVEDLLGLLRALGRLLFGQGCHLGRLGVDELGLPLGAVQVDLARGEILGPPHRALAEVTAHAADQRHEPHAGPGDEGQGDPDVAGIPTWIAWVYAAGGPPNGALGRQILHELNLREQMKS